MEIIFTICSKEYERKDFIKVVEMVAIPHKGSSVDVGDREPKEDGFDIVFRRVSSLMFYPTGVEIHLETEDTDTTDFLERQGWKHTVGSEDTNKALGLLGDEMLPKGWSVNKPQSPVNDVLNKEMQVLVGIASEMNLGELDFQLLSQVDKEVKETFEETGLELPQEKHARLVLEFYAMAIEHNQQGLSLQDRVAALKKLAEG
jgi:hypothetical protein